MNDVYHILHLLLIDVSIAIAYTSLMESTWQVGIRLAHGEVKWDKDDHAEWLLAAFMFSLIPLVGEYLLFKSLWNYADVVEGWTKCFYKQYRVRDGVMYRKGKKYWWKEVRHDGKEK